MLKESILESKRYLRSIRREIGLSTLLFCGALLAGYAFAVSYPQETARYMEQMQSYFADISQETTWQTFLAILQNNLDAMLLVVALGVFAGLLPLFFLALNGFMIGLVAAVIFARMSPLVFFFGILPHGVLELPAMVFSAAIGLRIGWKALRRLFGGPADLTAEVAQGARFALTALVPLLTAAAFIEAYLTPLFIALARYLTGA
jgi:stage II sporulation protein M